jgi:alkanesulfonate monooxygenase SsuD/methylene tetrahydromethanopterin reductase-like flavin-dependent oxidoreductase (luciferase family)
MDCGVVIQPTNFTDWGRFHEQQWSEKPSSPDHKIWERGIAVLDLAEELGYDSVWTTEHRASPYGLIPNPLEFLAFVAGRTHNVSVGTQVVVLPWWHNPIRVAEEAAFVDALLQGRHLTLGVGRGVAPREYNTMGIDRNESRGRFTEGIEVVKKALTEERFSFDGEYFKYTDVVVRPRPHHDLVADMVGAFAGPDSLEGIAKAGLGMINTSGKPPQQIADDVATFNTFRAERGLEPTQPIIQFVAYCAETEEQAATEGAAWFENFGVEVEWHYRFSDPAAFEGVKGYEMYVEVAKKNATHVFQRQDELLYAGTPEMLVERIRALQEASSAKAFIGNFFLAGMPVEVAERSMRLFAKEVLPALHEMDAPLHPHCRAKLPDPA